MYVDLTQYLLNFGINLYDKLPVHYTTFLCLYDLANLNVWKFENHQ